MQHRAPAPHRRHHWWRRRLRLLATFDFWLGVVIVVVVVLGLITVFRMVVSSVAICIHGMNC